MKSSVFLCENLLVKSISTRNHMFEGMGGGRGAISNILKIYTKNLLNQTCDYCLTAPNQQTLCIETNIF